MSAVAPLVSVLMPVYNAQRYVADAIQSILAQTYSDFEFIIIDDGSTDGSSPILRTLAASDDRIRLVQRDNRGIVKSLNEGLEIARGQFLARMDADDLSDPNRLGQQLEYLQNHPELAGVASDVLFIDPDGLPIGPKADQCHLPQEVDQALLRGAWPVVHPSVTMRLDLVRRIGGYRDYPTWEDHDLFLRLGENGGVAIIPQILLRYRLHLESVVHQRADGKGQVLQNVIIAACERRGLPVPLPEQLPSCQPMSGIQHQRNWIWWALAAGNIGTARRHAMDILRKAPLSVDSWRLVACAVRGR